VLLPGQWLRIWVDVPVAHWLRIQADSFNLFNDLSAHIVGTSVCHRRGHAKLCRRGGQRSTTVRPHCGHATAANWLIDVIDCASSYLAVGITHTPISPHVYTGLLKICY